jgi:voltage-gated sodium channel
MGTAQSSGFSRFVLGKAFSNFILTVVFLNAIVIGFQCYPGVEAVYGPLLNGLDITFLAIFTIEVIFKLFVSRSKYFKDSWNLFDFIVVAASLVFITSQFVSVLRILRVLRVLKTISSVPSLRRIITSLFMAVPTIGSIALLMVIVFFIYGVVGATFYADLSPDYFGDLSRSLITLFQIVTFDDWANIYRPIAEHSPFSLVYFVSFIFIAVFIMLNLVIGEISNNASKIPDDVQEEIKEDSSEIALLRKELRELRVLLVEHKEQRYKSS